MAEFILNAEVRTNLGKGHSRRLRCSGLIPAVIYGKTVTPVHCSLKRRDVEVVFQKATRNTIIKVDFGSASAARDVIIRDFQEEPISRKVTHLDLQAIDWNTPVKVQVDINFVGEPIGKKAGAVFTSQTRTVRIECLPAKIPTAIDVDVAALDVGHSLHVSDIPKSEFKIVSNPKLTLCQMSVVKEEAGAVAPGATAEAAAGAAPVAGAAPAAGAPAAAAAAPAAAKAAPAKAAAPKK
ncbi:MAG: 50S ribosomal protein L25 [Candidatus Riflebacteria bacterium]|nr:50S ribosomal protein L25 [Candidatus Riflebacteria bacterium]